MAKKLNNLAFSAFLSALILYFFTLAPTIGWGDSADLAIRIATNTDTSFNGTSREYNLFRSLGRIFQAIPIGDIGIRTNLMTAFFGAISVGLVSYITGYITKNKLAAAGAGICLAFSHTFWFLSVTAEVYTFNTALILTSFTGITIWYRTCKTTPLVIACLFAGLALTHHATGLVLTATLVPLLLIRWRQLHTIAAALSLLAFLAASFPYWVHVYVHFTPDKPILKSLGLLAENNPFFDVNSVRESLKFLAYAFYNFSGLAFFLIAPGLISTWKNRYLELTPPTIWAAMLIFAGTTSSIPDKFNIYVLAYPTLAIFSGIGLAYLEKKYSFRKNTIIIILTSLIIAPITTYGLAVWFSGKTSLDLVGAREAPYRNNAKYFLWPPKNGDYGPRRYAEEALSQVKPGSILIADYTLLRPLMYVQTIDSMRPDVEIVFVEKILSEGVDNYIDRKLNFKYVYLATNTPASYYQLDKVKEKFNIDEVGVVFFVARK